MRGPVGAGNPLDPVEDLLFREDMGKERKRARGGETARAAAGGELGGIGVRGAVGAEKEARVAGGGSRAQRQSVAFPLGHRQAVVMRAQAAGQQVVAVEDQVGGVIVAAMSPVASRA